jgi:hypothetical protein
MARPGARRGPAAPRAWSDLRKLLAAAQLDAGCLPRPRTQTKPRQNFIYIKKQTPSLAVLWRDD